MNKFYNHTKKIMISFVISLLIINILMLIFAVYEYYIYWDNPWCTQQQTLEPELSIHRSIIMIHGYGGSPFDFKPLAQKLQQQGFFVTIPIMPGQNKDYFAYTRGQFSPNFYINWLQDIIEKETKRFEKKPYLIGFSMGGTLSTIVAAEGTVEKLILLAPFYSLPTKHDTLVSVNKILGSVLPIVPKFASGKVYSDEGRSFYVPGTYIVSGGAFKQLNKLAMVARKKVKELTIPTFVAGSHRDQVASFAMIQKLFSANLRAEIKEYPQSNHIILYDYARDEVVTDVLAFVKSKH